MIRNPRSARMIKSAVAFGALFAFAGLAGAQTVAGAAVTAAVSVDDDHRKGNAHGQQSEQAKREEVIAFVADAVNRVFSNKGLDSILEIVAKTDRERVGRTLDDREHQRFIDRADQVARTWREKYGQNFDAAENQRALRELGIVFTTDGGRERATVQFPSQGGRSRFDLRLIRDNDGPWRIILPDSVTAGNFADRMDDSMRYMLDQAQAGKWPEDRTEGYKSVTAQALHSLASETGRSTSERD
jgi:hypothetical protein